MQKPLAASIYLKFILFPFYFAVFFISCTTSKKTVLYFADLPGDTILHNLVNKDFQLKIRKGDVLNIGVSSLSMENSTLFMAPQMAAASGGGAGLSAGPGYLVDVNGNILYPKLGLVHVEGITRDELRDRLLKDLSPYLKEPVITVTFVNHKITILGDIGHPQVLPMTSDNMTLLDAISLSGELTKTSRETNILVIRDTGADKQFKRLNLNNSSIFYSPFYYLKPDDILYVEQDPAKIKTTNNTQQVIGFVTTGISLLFLILSRIK